MKNRKVAYVVMTLALAVAVFLAWLLLLSGHQSAGPALLDFCCGNTVYLGDLARL